MRRVNSNTNITILAVFFIAGALIGCFFAGMSSGSGFDYMSRSISNLIGNAGSGGISVRLLDAFTSNIKLPLFVFLLGMTAYGSYTVPLMFTTRGFLLAYTCSAIVRVLGFSGLMVGVSLFLPTNIISLPAFLYLGIQAMSQNKRNYYERSLFCLALFIVSALVEAFITPRLLIYIITKFGIL